MKPISSLIILLLLIYLVTYGILSSRGEYDMASTGSARMPLFSVSIPDSQQWQPKYLDLQVMKTKDGSWTTHGNVGGYIFAPLILIDRKTWHPNKELLE